MHARAAEIGIQQHGWRDDVADTAAEHVRLVMAGAYAGIARRPARIAAQRLAQRSAAR